MLVFVLVQLMLTFQVTSPQPWMFKDKCESYSLSVFWKKCGGCGLCQHYEFKNVNEPQMMCDYTFLKTIFIPESTKKCVIVNNCLNSTIKDSCNSLPCVPLLGTVKCQCNGTTIGRLCQYDVAQGKALNDYAVLENFLYTPYFQLNEYLTISLMFSYLGKDVKVVIETLTERLTYNSQAMQSDLDSTVSIDKCKDLYPHTKQFCTSNIFRFKNVKWIFTANIPFPGRAFKSDARKYVYQGNVTKEKHFYVGQLEPIKLAIYNKNDKNPLFDVAFFPIDISLSPEFHVCEPHVFIKEGAQTMFDVIKIPRSKEIVVYTSYRMSGKECQPPEDMNIIWRVWIYDINHIELSQDCFIERFHVGFIKFPDFSLEQGLYKVRSNVTIWKDRMEGFSVAYCYFEVVLTEIEPIILGGYSRSLYYKTQKVIINGSMSLNPNLSLLDQEEDLRFYWECDKGEKQVGKYSVGNYITYYGPFNVSEVYTFKLTVISQKYKIRKSAVQKITMVPDPMPTLEIICRKNCGGFEFKSNPEESTYLEVFIVDVPSTMKKNDKFTWKYKDEKEEGFRSVEDIKQSNTPDHVLIVLANTLQFGGTFLFQVTGGSNISGEASFQLKMATQITNFSCVLDRKDVYKGVFDYEINCDRLLFDNISPTYDYYDTFPDSKTEDKGRLLGSQKTHILQQIGYTRGKLLIEVTNHYGITFTTEININIKKGIAPVKLTESLINDLEIYHTTMDPDYKTNIISAIVDIIYYEAEKFPSPSTIIERLLVIVSNEEMDSFQSMKMWTFAIEVLATQGEHIELSLGSVLQLSRLVLKLSVRLKYYVLSSHNVFNYFTTKEIFQLVQSLVDICEKVYSSKNYEMEDTSYTSYRESSENNFLAIENVMLTLQKRTLPFMKPLIVKGNHINIWLKEDTPHSFYKLSSNQTLNESIPSVVISKSLSNFLNHLSHSITIQVVVYDGNPYWWDKKLAINTEVVDVKLMKKSDEYITKLPYPVQINLHYQELEMTIINGTVLQPNVTASQETADTLVQIHKVRVVERGMLKLKFLNLKEGEVVKVLVLFNFRPDYELVMEMGQNITHLSPEYDLELKAATSDDYYDLHYIGILPGYHTPVGKYMNYSFEMTIVRCVSWHSTGWLTRGCYVKDILPDSKQLQCECEHLSSIAGFAGIPINEVDPFTDYKLLLTILDNPFVTAFIICLLLLYFVILFYTVRKDYRDKYKQCAIYLEDNLPFDKYPYLMCVYTGARLFAGTTSNVGIVVKGESSVSRRHILRGTDFKALERGDDNWFVMFTPFYLGEIKLLHIWMDYSGKRPEWYCNKIVVIDLAVKKEYMFLINAWLSLRWDSHIEMFVKTETVEDRYREDLASDSLIFGFREGHLWFSILSKHPRSSVNSSQRLSLAVCGLFAAMLVSCMFYKVLEDQQEDYPQYKLSEKELIISVYGMIISAFITNIVTSLFRKELVIFSPSDDEEEGEESESAAGINQPVEETSKKESNEKVEIYCFRFVYAILKASVSKKKFIPITLEIDIFRKTKKQNKKKKCYDIFVWSICIFVIVFSAYLVILYGLKFGKVKSLEWFSSNVMSLVEEIFVVSPLKIICLATLSGLLFAKIYEVIKYDVNLSVISKYKDLLHTNQNLLTEIVILRKNEIYIPLTYKEISNKQVKQWKRDALCLLLDVLIIGLFALVLFIQSSTLWTTTYYWNNLQLKSLMEKIYKEEGFQLHEIGNITDYLPFLEKEILPSLYELKWYNELLMRGNISSDARAFSSTSTLFGLPRLRQHRQKPGLCRPNSFNGLPDICDVTLSSTTEDTDLYGEGWITTGSYGKFIKSSAWNYVKPSETYHIVDFGFSDVLFNDGGYIANLGMSEAESDDVIFYLANEKWLDKLTSMVIFEMTLYNPNTGTLSMLIAVTERLYIGVLMNRLYVYTISQGYNYPLIDFILLASLCTFIIRVILVASRRGIRKTIVHFWNIFELAIVFLSIYCAYLYIQNIKKINDYLEIYKKRDKEQHFHLLKLVTDLTNVQVVTIVLVVMLACRFMKSLRFGYSLDILFYTVLSAWHTLLWIFIFIFLIVLVYWRSICYFLNNFVQSRTFLMVLHKMDFKHTVRNCVQVNCKISLFILCMISDVFTVIIVMHYLHVYKVIKVRWRI